MVDFDNNEEIKAHQVRLFPSVRISSSREAELRATASLLAMVRAVSEFGRVIVKVAGGPVGRVSCYTEVGFQDPSSDETASLRPDGIIRVVRGRTDWKALVEVKVGDNPLDQKQFDSYHQLAKREPCNALITISNQAALSNGLPPLSVDGRRLRSVPVFHLSWERLLSEARILSRRKEVEDPDQRWMLDEWIRYVADPNSKIIEPPHLGDHWNEILRAAREGNLSSVSRRLQDVVRRWDGFVKKAALRLSAKLGVEVEPRISRSERRDPDERIKRLQTTVLKEGCLASELKIPDAAGDVSMQVILQAKAVRFGVVLEPPSEGRASTRVNWLVRQLKSLEAPEKMIVEVEWDRGRLVSQGRLGDVLADSSCLMRDSNRLPIPRDAVPRRYALEWTTSLPKGKGRSTARVLEGISASLEEFYKRVVEGLLPYVPPAPRLPKEDEAQVAASAASDQPTREPESP